MNGSNRTRGRSSSSRPRGPRRGNSSTSETGRQNPNSNSPLDKIVRWFKGLFKTKALQAPINSARLYIGNLSYDTAENDLREYFSKVGAVKVAEIIWDRNSNRSKGFAFVEMESLDDAKKAACTFHEKEFMGRKLIVSGAKSEGERKSRD